jgi:hypothetical protein
VWAIPKDGAICLADQKSRKIIGLVCMKTGMVLKRGIAIIYLSEAPGGIIPGKRLVLGLAPDDTGAVIARTHKSLTRIPVVRGIFILRDRAFDPPDRLTLVRNWQG